MKRLEGLGEARTRAGTAIVLYRHDRAYLLRTDGAELMSTRRHLSEDRLGLDPWLEAPVQLAPLIDRNLHSCGTVYPHGAAELAHPEPGFHVAGMKSCRRADVRVAHRLRAGALDRVRADR